MRIVDLNHKNTFRSIAVAALVFTAGFGSGIYGAHALVSSSVPHEALLPGTQIAHAVTLPKPAKVAVSAQKLPAPQKATKSGTVAPAAKTKNQLVVPRMGVNSAILEGDEKTLNKGIWHVPGTSNPALGGNTVISAHRYKWRPPSTKTFWDIDKMKVGDEITITWEGKLYRYKVAKTYIVKPDRVDILANTKKPKLTLFSCTPKFTSKNRLVVEAYPIEA